MEHQPTARVLLELSGYKDAQLATQMDEIVERAPDAETATRHMFKFIPVESAVLRNKWRKYISQLWSTSHPHALTSVQIPITSKEVAFAPVLVEIHMLLRELIDHPARVHEDTKAHFLHPSEESRLALECSLFGQDTYHVRRVCALLEELRLIRPYKGHVRVIDSRYRAFAALPLPSQYYLLWHVDMYHLDWKEYFHDWGSHLAVFQQYLPMVWEMVSRIQAGDVESLDALTSRIVRSFRPVWQQELAMGLYEQSVLESMVELWLIEKVFTRYGFIALDDSRMIQWTSAGQTMIDLERTTKLPCSTDAFS